ncbi:MAG: carbohydrate ABC transporter permease [Spirochaetales bacterium]|nr:carbohydrate ABC transporter permease [Spirochaetales bacterium]MDY5907912.1 carbohydrate ABC transporter permease [Bullifex sp.]
MDQIQKNQTKTKAYSVFSLVVLIVIALLFLFPFYWIITGSFKVQPNKIPPEWFPASWTVMHWEKLFRQPAWTWFFNSVFMSVMSMILVLMASSMAGYVLAKKAFTGRKIIFSLLVMAMALPKQVILVPLVRMMNALSLYNTLWAVILGTVGWPFGTFLMKQFSEGIPTELLEAAKIDGSGETRTFLSVVCPMLKPAFGALAIFTFINTWNDYFLQLVMLTSRNNLSISLGIATLQAELSTDYGLIMAGATLGAVPIVTIFVMFQKYFTNGIALGAVKG